MNYQSFIHRNYIYSYLKRIANGKYVEKVDYEQKANSKRKTLKLDICQKKVNSKLINNIQIISKNIFYMFLETQPLILPS